jgi:dihydroneopterin aldolase
MGVGEPGSLADRIELRGIELLVFCGVLDEEQARRQPFIFDVDIYLDLSVAAASDDLTETVNYGATIELIAATLDRERFLLLERMATRVADLVLSDANAVAVTVAARKVRPPVPSILASTGVRIHRSRS